MLFGASRAQSVIMTHPNHAHLLKVLQETKSEIMAGRGPGSPSSPSSDNPFPETQSSSPSWPSEKQDTYPSTTNSKDGFDEDTLLSDEEINRQNQGGKYFRFPIHWFSISLIRILSIPICPLFSFNPPSLAFLSVSEVS